MSGFDLFWAAYPRKVGKAEAMVAYAKALKGQLRRQRECGLGPATHEEIMAGVASYRRDKPDYADWKHGSTFLNKVSWIDEGGSDEAEKSAHDPVRDLEHKRYEHESGLYMYPSLATKHGWAEFGSVRPELRVVVSG
jgi:hypothetical protein